jgi:hypothetical protein
MTSDLTKKAAPCARKVSLAPVSDALWPTAKAWVHVHPLGQTHDQWGEGPWLDEPDVVIWGDADTFMTCFAIRNMAGAWCGYVAVDDKHPLYGVAYTAPELDDAPAHGGLTYSGAAHELSALVQAGFVRNADTASAWLFGFDCCHAFDLMPAVSIGFDGAGENYRPLGYVKSQCEELASWLNAASRGQD